jgi:ATP synthase protein I
MDRSPEEEGQKIRDDFIDRVSKEEARKIKARQLKHHGIWFGLGMIGMIGWSISIPTLAGLALGIWIDRNWPSQVPWTLTLLIVGLVLGLANAWYWVMREQKAIEREREERRRE